ncbi:MAG: DUF1289 domain-containing protein [Rhodospirillaceae bacterium]|nr:DUF1289 domain-containing protein [Rhodospirillaceae bacterium]
MNRISEFVRSPCVDICRIDKDTALCAGCFRTIDEIMGWLDLSSDGRREVLRKVEERRKVMGAGRPPYPR